MTREHFYNILFQKGMKVKYRGRVYEITAVDFDTGEIAFFNERAVRMWRKCEKLELV